MSISLVGLCRKNAKDDYDGQGDDMSIGMEAQNYMSQP